MNSILTLEEKGLWMLEIKEPEHKHMNFDSVYTYPSMKGNVMEKYNRKHIHNKEREKHIATRTIQESLFKICVALQFLLT